MEKFFPASLNATTKSITGAIFLLAILAPLIIRNSIKSDDVPIWLPWLMPALLLIVLAGAFLYRPLGYVVGPSGIGVRRMMGTVRWAAAEMVEVRQISNDEIGYPIRIFGNGGVFGFTGWFRSGKMGWMRWYCTRRENFVVIVLNEKYQRIITPDEPAELVRYWNETVRKSK